MYAIVKTGGKQYKVAAGDILVTEKLQGEIGDKVELRAIAVVKGDKVLVFKFKKRKNYKKLRGHRQLHTRLKIESIG